MSGRFLLDTNAVIQLLKGNSEIAGIIKNADFLACSIISELEYISFPTISENDKLLLSEFLSRISVIDITHGNADLKEQISKLRQFRKIKLPDAIILASAMLNDCILITADKDLLKFMSDDIEIMGFNPDI